jgi:hypothetical protein
MYGALYKSILEAAMCAVQVASALMLLNHGEGAQVTLDVIAGRLWLMTDPRHDGLPKQSLRYELHQWAKAMGYNCYDYTISLTAVHG